MIRYNNFRFIGKLFFIISIGIFLYGEIISYIVYYLQWNSLKCPSPDQSTCIRILFVADPQILGENDASTIARWDSDRFLSMTYNNAYFYFKPNVTVFLGDIMDEGSVATPQQYKRYLKRLNDIFYLKQLNKVIVIPGDNDIGGESNDFITASKINRFKNQLAKNQQDITHINNISFYAVNRLTEQYSMPALNDNKIRVIISHVPLTYTPAHFVDVLLKKIRPTVIFSAHIHMSLLMKNFDDTREFIEMNANENRVKNVQFDDADDILYEFIVPTCSYRMGELHMGYGAAIIDTNLKSLTYTVFWLPPRLIILWSYVIFISISFILLCIYKTNFCNYCRNRKIIRYYKV